MSFLKICVTMEVGRNSTCMHWLVAWQPTRQRRSQASLRKSGENWISFVNKYARNSKDLWAHSTLFLVEVIYLARFCCCYFWVLSWVLLVSYKTKHKRENLLTVYFLIFFFFFFFVWRYIFFWCLPGRLRQKPPDKLLILISKNQISVVAGVLDSAVKEFSLVQLESTSPAPVSCLLFLPFTPMKPFFSPFSSSFLFVAVCGRNEMLGILSFRTFSATTHAWSLSTHCQQDSQILAVLGLYNALKDLYASRYNYAVLSINMRPFN